MATQDPINGADFIVYVDGVAVVRSTNATITPSHSTREGSSKDSEWMFRYEGRLDWSCEVEALFAFDSAFGYTQLYDTMVARTPVQIRFSTEVSGDRFWQGQAYITELPIEAPDQETSTFSISFDSAGPLETKTST